LLRRAAAVSTTDTNQSDRCAAAHDQSRLWWGQARGGGGRDRPAFPSPLRLISWPFASHSGALKGHLLSLNRPRRDEPGGRCDGAISRLSSGCRRRCSRCDGHNRFQHPGRIPDRVQASYQTAVNSSEAVRQSDEWATLTAFNNESGQQPIADLMCATKAAAIRISEAHRCSKMHHDQLAPVAQAAGAFSLPPQRTSNPVICITVLEGGRA
jgi:hypothetical protein